MATDEALAYLVALSVPVWLLIEHAVEWLRSRRSLRDERAQVNAQVEVPRPAGAGAPEATRRAA